jgi:hypothetical protein
MTAADFLHEPTNTLPHSTPKRDLAPPSPAPTMLSFKQGDDQDGIAQSPPPPQRVDLLTRDIGGDTRSPNNKSPKGNMARKRSSKGANYYSEVFGVRHAPTIPKIAGVCAELKTNVIVSECIHHALSLFFIAGKRYDACHLPLRCCCCRYCPAKAKHLSPCHMTSLRCGKR